MFETLLQVHSVLRWPVLLAPLVGLVQVAMSWSQGVDSRAERVTAAVFLALLDTQLLIGVVLLFLVGTIPEPAVTHGILMLVAVVAAHYFRVRMRRAPSQVYRWAIYAVPFVVLVAGVLVVL